MGKRDLIKSGRDWTREAPKYDSSFLFIHGVDFAYFFKFSPFFRPSPPSHLHHGPRHHWLPMKSSRLKGAKHRSARLDARTLRLDITIAPPATIGGS